nr:TIGR03936 family radical SAM-associated protein [Microlunatus panaciterrae]
MRLRYAKRGRARFTSHRDFSRAFERALRRAGIPMAYSSGFSPHPRISYANASPTGAASEAEYLEIGLAAECDPDRVRAALDEALPPGLDVVEAIVAPPGALADLLTGSLWQIRLPGIDAAELGAACENFLGQSSVLVQRMTKNGIRSFDARQAVVSLRVSDGEILLVCRHQTPLVRPDDVLTALGEVSPSFAPVEVPVITRLAQGTLEEETGEIADPLTVR